MCSSLYDSLSLFFQCFGFNLAMSVQRHLSKCCILISRCSGYFRPGCFLLYVFFCMRLYRSVVTHFAPVLFRAVSFVLQTTFRALSSASVFFFRISLCCLHVADRTITESIFSEHVFSCFFNVLKNVL